MVIGTTEKKNSFSFPLTFDKKKGALISAEVGRLLVDDGITDFQMTIAGDGPEYKSLQKYINRHKLNHYINT